MTIPPRLVGVVLFAGAIGIGILVTSLMLGVIGGSGEPTPSVVAVVSASPGEPSPSASASIEPSVSPSSPPSAGPSPSAVATPAKPTATPKPTTAPGEPASITFTALKLDAKEDPDGRNRVLTFQTQGAGTVRARIVLESPRGEAIACLRTTKKDFGCTTTDGGGVTAVTNARRADFTLTLRGEGIAAPIVDVELDFPAAAPAVTIDHARFDGTSFPETNGIDATLTPRRDGDVHLVAEWGGHPLLYEIDLIEQGGPGVHALTDQGPAPGTDTRLAVAAPNPWRLVLENTETGFGVTPLTATISWP